MEQATDQHVFVYSYRGDDQIYFSTCSDDIIHSCRVEFNFPSIGF